MLPETEKLAVKLKEEYKVPVMPISIEAMSERDMYNILKEALYEFPIEEVRVNMPEWINFSKLRASFAAVGNDAPSYIIHQYYSFSPGSGNGFITRDAAKALADLKPESTQSIELSTE